MEFIQSPLGIATLIAAGVLFSFTAAGLAIYFLPADYFTRAHPLPLARRTPMQIVGMVGKNLLGLGLMALGAVMSIPGVPGQGLLTILVGLVLVDFPGKYKLERRIFRIALVQRGINRIRVRLGKPAFTVE